MGTAACGGKGFKERAGVSGEEPLGAAGCRPQYNQVSCQPPPPPQARQLPSSVWTRHREVKQVWGLCWHNRPRERKGKEW